MAAVSQGLQAELHLGSDQARALQGSAVPGGGLDRAQLLQTGAAPEAPEAHEISAHVTLGTVALAQVVAHAQTGEGAAEPHEEDMGNQGTLLVQGGCKHLGGGAEAAAVPAEHAPQGILNVAGATAAGLELPELVAGAGLATPVQLVQTDAALDATGLNLADDRVEAHSIFF